MFNYSVSTRRGGAVAMATLGLGAVVITHDPHLVTVGGPTWSGPARLRVTVLCLLAAVSLYLLWRLYKLLFYPLVVIRTLEDVGYLAEDGRSKAQAANEVRRRRKVGDLPPVYPNGWYRVLDSMALKRGQVKSVTVLGQEVAVFRGEDGKAFVLDAYCPHLGANLAVGGKVVGNCVECPFHGWQFDGNDGKCVKIPYSKKVPEVAKVRRWHTCEVNGHIMVWFHCDGDHPEWAVPEKREIGSGEWVYRGRTEHVINAHIQEIPENAGDIAHLNYLHTAGMVSGSDLRYTNNKLFEFFQHDWTAHWEPDTESSRHISKMFLKHKIFLFGHHFPLLDAQVLAQQIGPGLVLLDFEKFSIGRGTIVQCVTPVEPLLQLVTHTIYFQANVLPLIPKFILTSERIQFERDVMIWNNKKYVSKPLIVKEDSAIRKHRRWFSQFYSDNSPQLQYQCDTLDF